MMPKSEFSYEDLEESLRLGILEEAAKIRADRFPMYGTHFMDAYDRRGVNNFLVNADEILARLERLGDDIEGNEDKIRDVLCDLLNFTGLFYTWCNKRKWQPKLHRHTFSSCNPFGHSCSTAVYDPNNVSYTDPYAYIDHSGSGYSRNKEFSGYHDWENTTNQQTGGSTHPCGVGAHLDGDGEAYVRVEGDKVEGFMNIPQKKEITLPKTMVEEMEEKREITLPKTMVEEIEEKGKENTDVKITIDISGIYTMDLGEFGTLCTAGNIEELVEKIKQKFRMGLDG